MSGGTGLRMCGMSGGKSHLQAMLAAAALKRGGRVALATRDGIFEVVGVPGFDDGRQLPAPEVTDGAC